MVQNVPIQKSPRFFGKAIQICISRYDNKRQAMHKSEKHDDNNDTKKGKNIKDRFKFEPESSPTLFSHRVHDYGHDG